MKAVPIRMELSVVVACCNEGGIGKGGNLPWKLKGDMSFFRSLTTLAPDGKENAVIMGRKTFLSIPERFRPLPNRVNVVLSRMDTLDLPDGVYHSKSLDEAIGLITSQLTHIHRVFIIGGSSVYQEALAHGRLDSVYLTRVYKTIDCDTFLPLDNIPNFKQVQCDEMPSGMQTEGEVQYEFLLFKKPCEQQFEVSMVVAMCANRGIGYNRSLPWPFISTDYKNYNEISSATTRPDGIAVNIRGRITYECVGDEERARPTVMEIVITSDPSRVPKLPPSQIAGNLDEALRLCRDNDKVDGVYILGGTTIFQAAMYRTDCDIIVLTEIEGDFPSDTFFPRFEHLFYLQKEGELITENGVTYRLANVYKRKSLTQVFSDTINPT